MSTFRCMKEFGKNEMKYIKKSQSKIHSNVIFIFFFWFTFNFIFFVLFCDTSIFFMTTFVNELIFQIQIWIKATDDWLWSYVGKKEGGGGWLFWFHGRVSQILWVRPIFGLKSFNNVAVRPYFATNNTPFPPRHFSFQKFWPYPRVIVIESSVNNINKLFWSLI